MQDQIKHEEIYRGYRLVVFAKDDKMCHIFDIKNPNTPLTGCGSVENAKKWVDKKAPNEAPKGERAPADKLTAPQSVEQIFEKNKIMSALFDKRGKINNVRMNLKTFFAKQTGIEVKFFDIETGDEVTAVRFAKKLIEYAIELADEYFAEVDQEITNLEGGAQ